jgi:hypothetical protein
MIDLFGVPPLAGLAMKTGIVSPSEEAMLADRIDRAGLAPFRFQGWLGKRLTASYGTGYDFDAGRLEIAQPIPDWLDSLCGRAAQFAGLRAEDLSQALLIRYDPGAGIGWHRDRPLYEHVIGISLGAGATMRFRRRGVKGFDRVAVPLAPRSIYHLAGEARHDWEHSIAELASTRWSITFRSLSSSGAAALRRASVPNVNEGDIA